MRIVGIILFLLIVHFCKAQNFHLNESERFAYQVKQLDELIERFNGEDHTLIKEYIGKINPNAVVDRTVLIKTLFDAQKPDWNLPEVKTFIDYVNDANQPVFLNFDDDAWYAEAKCAVVYKGKRENVQLVLKVQKEQNNGLKWVLVSAKSNFLSNSATKNDFLIPSPQNNKSSINPISHATEFMNLDLALYDTKNISNYIARDCTSADLLVFFQELNNKNLVFEQVNSVIYHFLQINGWGFTVQKFKRPIKNSGWLVSKLTRMDEGEKQRYLASVLNISR
ncbi:hypothetical protein GCM10023188_36360 [Pontibacter saemangeumensis]|uniref:DUF3828 domain-containing protein n=1 Tax=Pontibacter saemangeumensis TaxID=1084525 RepID=A0ABP8LXP8_9BACT